VVVADDVQANRAVAVAMLGMVGFKTVEARDGKEALQQMSEHAADAVIMDVMMPVLDGLEAIRIARSTPELRATRVIAVSASSYESDMQHAMAAGADAFLPKPLDFDKLLSTIGPLLQLAWICEG
jgi:CheY-like chemotaxis protein